MDKLNRRTMLTSALAGMLALGGQAGAAHAQSAEQAAAFIEQAGKDLTAVINAPGPISDKQAQLRQIVDRIVDVDAVARFCLGRYWRTASPEQQRQYLDLFHQVLLKSVITNLGNYQGVSFAVGRTVASDSDFTVSTVVSRAGTAPANVQWVVSMAGGAPRIVDLIAEGTSLRLTQRSDYAAYLAHNGDNLQALLDAMRQKLTQSG
jgi:phospholipid transport system substrate-binding protein